MCLRIREIHWRPHGVSDNVDKCLFVIGNVSGIGCSEAGGRPVATAMRVRGPGSSPVHRDVNEGGGRRAGANEVRD
jgi:hypothetical protein